MNERKELILDLARILTPAPRERNILHITEGREIEVNTPRLADALLAAGYRKATS
jgi:hypothetical protein